jgi:hypothetical protein
MKFQMLLVVSAIFALTACPATPSPTPTPQPAPSNIGCSAETLVDSAAAGAFASIDGCTATAQITSDIQAVWTKLGINFCGTVATLKKLQAVKKLVAGAHPELKFTSATGPIADLVCPLAVSGIDSIVGTQVPSNWLCTGSASVDATFTAACELIPF